MGFQITTPTDIPTNLDGTHDSWTWGEAGGPFSVPAGETAGLGNVILTADTVNYEWQHGARWSRALRDRMAMSDEGLLTTCVLSQGTWNTGGGTLGVTLTPTRLVIDVDGDGGTVIEVTAPVGSPETLTANRDTYVDFNEAGGYTLVAVANGAGEPAVTAGHVRVYKLVTDGTELTSADLVSGVAAFPCLGPTIGAFDLRIDDTTITGTATVSGELSASGVSTFSGPLVNHTHVVASDWRDSLRPSMRTFAVGGTVNGGADPYDLTITSASAVDASTLFVGLPANGLVTFEIVATVFIDTVGGSNSVATIADASTITGSITAKRVAGTWSQQLSTLVQVKLIDQVDVSLINNGGQAQLRFAFNGAHALAPYRLVCSVTAHTLALNA